MSEKITIIVTPSEGSEGELSIDDAMRQVLDAFSLLVGSDQSNESIVWRLVEAKTNSPFTVTAEARSKKIGVDVDLIAKTQKSKLQRGFQELSSGKIPEYWRKPELRKIASEFVDRNLNGVATTEIALDDKRHIDFRHSEAVIAKTAFVERRSELSKRPKKQYGSIEGVLFDVSTHYNQPAVRIEERLTGKSVWCVIDEASRDQIAEDANFNDVWSGQRVRVRGTLEYSGDGELQKVYASEIEPVKERTVPLRDIRDRDFTSGLSPSQYVDKLREGEIE